MTEEIRPIQFKFIETESFFNGKCVFKTLPGFAIGTSKAAVSTKMLFFLVKPLNSKWIETLQLSF